LWLRQATDCGISRFGGPLVWMKLVHGMLSELVFLTQLRPHQIVSRGVNAPQGSSWLDAPIGPYVEGPP
jgi:hypothetical protein